MTEQDPRPTAWLALVAGENREHGGNDGYDDEPARHYSWDSSVPNHSKIRQGDAIVLWEERGLLGASIIERIETDNDEKWVHRCVACSSAHIKSRRQLTPRYKCYSCKSTFDVPSSSVKPVMTYRSKHDVGWVDLAGSLTAHELRQLAYQPQSQNSFRALRWDAFREAVNTSGLGAPLRLLDAAAEQTAGGHRRVTVRVRLGQAGFRRQLLDEFGSVCVFSGPTPVEALEAAHLYSYAAEGKHHSGGGFLMRRDLHRLFDLGLLAVDPATTTIDAAPELRTFPDYAGLHGRRIAITPAKRHLSWLRLHWDEHRTAVPTRLSTADPSAA
ncbi:HNH endonuclease [Actinoplanes sp. TRM 88003]|uniref:HNH endonuclease n=1 Tax=Paractinoplanes aksuensis TaxID=2939490 RepID=A0ABT1DXL8_9ACTN|nr:HNH endonuclease signature motif containing protein [Actinoplanes aksuensis]MCO8274791.1 HNH endonuclease [Actinoplanes aksuensis]